MINNKQCKKPAHIKRIQFNKICKKTVDNSLRNQNETPLQIHIIFLLLRPKLYWRLDEEGNGNPRTRILSRTIKTALPNS